MGVTISHASGGSHMHRSYGHIADLGKHLAHVLPGRDWRHLRELFDGRFADQIVTSHRKAGRIADILTRAATDHRMPPHMASDARTIADTARRAAHARQPWIWS
ncbi:hypothetical protein ACLIYM_25275 [Streptomyces fenghuangensis]